MREAVRYGRRCVPTKEALPFGLQRRAVLSPEERLGLRGRDAVCGSLHKGVSDG